MYETSFEQNSNIWHFTFEDGKRLTVDFTKEVIEFRNSKGKVFPIITNFEGFKIRELHNMLCDINNIESKFNLL